jgi:hypothetical protein
MSASFKFGTVSANEVSCYVSMVYILVVKTKGKRLLERSGRRWKDIKIDHREMGWGRMDQIHLFEDRDQWSALVNTAVNIRVP